MNSTEIAALQVLIAAIDNPVVRGRAQDVFNLATSATGQQFEVFGNNLLLNDLSTILFLPASIDGKTAIFWSGFYEGVSNEVWATEVKVTQLDGQGYLYADTPAGQFAQSTAALDGSLRPPGTYSLLTSLASAMMGDQARARVARNKNAKNCRVQ